MSGPRRVTVLSGVDEPLRLTRDECLSSVGLPLGSGLLSSVGEPLRSGLQGMLSSVVSPSGLALRECMSSVHVLLRSCPLGVFVKRGQAPQVWPSTSVCQA